MFGLTLYVVFPKVAVNDWLIGDGAPSSRVAQDVTIKVRGSALTEWCYSERSDLDGQQC